MKINTTPILVLALLIFLTACGGGGGGATSSNGQSNNPPVANAGADQNVAFGSVINLTGNASSDIDGNQLTYSWSITSKPVGSTVSLTGTTSPTPYFSPDISGTYLVSLIVNDGKVNSTPNTVSIWVEPVLFNSLYSSLRSIFTKDPIETTLVFSTRAATELNAQKVYASVSTSSSNPNSIYATYDANLQQATIRLQTVGYTNSMTVGSMTAGMKCGFINGVVMDGSSYYLPIPTANIVVNVLPSDAIDLLSFNSKVVAEFKLNAAIPVAANMIDTLMPITNCTAYSVTGVPHSFTFYSINATVSKLRFVSKTSGKTLATFVY